MNAMGTKKSFEAGHRVIFLGEYIGTLREKNEFGNWTVDWEDGTNTGSDTFPESDLVHVNGGPGSAQRGITSIKRAAWDEGQKAGVTNRNNWDGWRHEPAEITNPYEEGSS